jgi:hypothetical protein
VVTQRDGDHDDVTGGPRLGSPRPLFRRRGAVENERLEETSWWQQADGDRVLAHRGAAADRENVFGGRHGPALQAGTALVERGIAGGMPELPGRPGQGVEPASPPDEGVQRGPEVASRLGELIHVASGSPRIRAALQQPGFNQVPEPVREHGTRDVQAGGEVTEPANAVEGVAQDEQGPALADNL